MRGPGPNMRVTKVIDPVTQTVLAYTIEGVFGRDDRVIWMDGRPHPSEYAEHTWDGFSTGKIAGNQLIVTTTHMKYGVIQRNGVPASPNSVMTEHFIRHGSYLTLVSIVDDPVYLQEPFIRTSQWVLSSNITPDQRFVFEPVDEVAGHDSVTCRTTRSAPRIRSSHETGHSAAGRERRQGNLVSRYEDTLKKLIADMAAKRVR